MKINLDDPIEFREGCKSFLYALNQPCRSIDMTLSWDRDDFRGNATVVLKTLWNGTVG